MAPVSLDTIVQLTQHIQHSFPVDQVHIHQIFHYNLLSNAYLVSWDIIALLDPHCPCHALKEHIQTDLAQSLQALVVSAPIQFQMYLLLQGIHVAPLVLLATFVLKKATYSPKSVDKDITLVQENLNVTFAQLDISVTLT